MKIVTIILRTLLGVLLLTFGLNKFFWFLADFDFTGYPEAEYLFNSLHYSWSEPVGKGYILGLVGLTEATVGLLLVLKKWVPFALVMLVPISINIILFHAFVNLPNIGPAIFVAAVNAFLMYKHWGAYRSMFV